MKTIIISDNWKGMRQDGFIKAIIYIIFALLQVIAGLIGATINLLFAGKSKYSFTDDNDSDPVIDHDPEDPKSNDISSSIALKYRGEIGRFSLEQWWHNSFTRSERKEIIQACRTYDGRDFLTTEKIPKPHWLMDNGEFWYKWGDDVDTMLAYADLCGPPYSEKFIEKALEMALSSQKVYKIEKAYAVMIYRYYRMRDDPKHFERAVWACKQLISITAETAVEQNKFGPKHIGFNQLAIIYEKQKKFKDAIELSRRAKEQGWWGDWDKRIDRCKKKMRTDTTKSVEQPKEQLRRDREESLSNKLKSELSKPYRPKKNITITVDAYKEKVELFKRGLKLYLKEKTLEEYFEEPNHLAIIFCNDKGEEIAKKCRMPMHVRSIIRAQLSGHDIDFEVGERAKLGPPGGHGYGVPHKFYVKVTYHLK